MMLPEYNKIDEKYPVQEEYKNEYIEILGFK